jgi:amino acid permease
VYTLANICKLYIGIAFLSVPQGFAEAGIYGALIGLAYILIINCFTTYLLVKARNKFKQEQIINLSDLADKLFGPKAKHLTEALIVVT